MSAPAERAADATVLVGEGDCPPAATRWAAVKGADGGPPGEDAAHSFMERSRWDSLVIDRTGAWEDCMVRVAGFRIRTWNSTGDHTSPLSPD